MNAPMILKYLSIISLLIPFSLFAQTLELEVSEIEESSLRLQVEGENGTFIVVELSGEGMSHFLLKLQVV
tara:strand:- start:9 stop:218 length:210 start_codon:yes stop_codon:yes gene_type:complete